MGLQRVRHDWVTFTYVKVRRAGTKNVCACVYNIHTYVCIKTTYILYISISGPFLVQNLVLFSMSSDFLFDIIDYKCDPDRSNESESESHSLVSDSLQPHGLYSPWNSPGQNTGMGQLFPSPGDLPNPGLPHCRWILYQLSHKGSPWSVILC